MSESTPPGGTTQDEGTAQGEGTTQRKDGPRRIELAGRRRAPRVRAVVLTGALIGLVIGLLVAWIAPGDAASQYTDRTVAGFLGMALALVGAVAGGGAAVVADRR